MKTKATSLLRFWFCLLTMVCLPVFLGQGQTFEQVWQLGVENGDTIEFHQENSAKNPPPGSPTALDDDYYFTGQYAAVGTVVTDEPLTNVERALTIWADTSIRVHFNLTPAQAAPQNNLRVTFKLISFNNDPICCDASPTATITAMWNDTQILEPTDVTDPTLVQIPLVAGDIKAVAGENMLTVERTATGNAWIQFDYLRLEVELAKLTFTASSPRIYPGEKVTLAWKTDPAATVLIDGGVGDVTANMVNGSGSVEVSPTETTTYTITSITDQGNEAAMANVIVSLINKFTASATSIRVGSPVTLSWVVDANTTLVIDGGVGNVTAKTVNGAGSTTAYPDATTTYTLTATRGAQNSQESVSVSVDARKLLWQVGYEDNSQAEFHQEGGGVNPLPGSPTAIDNDYYFAGEYPAPIGLVAQNEPFGNFERALTDWDVSTRIHFNLTEAEAASENNFYITFKMFSFNTDPGYATGPASIWATWNDIEILPQTEITDPTTEALGPLRAADIGAVPGTNVVTISRAAAGNAWIQFDYVRAEVELIDPTAGLLVAFDASTKQVFPGQKVMLTWKVDSQATLTIDQGVGNVTADTVNGVGSIEVSPTATTTYTLTSTKGAYSLNASVRVVVAMINSFTASSTSITKGASITLDWNVDPAASVSLAPTFGNVNAHTAAGIGSLTVTPVANTTYTLTATKTGFSAQASVAVVVNPYSILWEVGLEDDSQAEFAQEGGSVNPLPGSPAAIDNDYYFAGTYFALDPAAVATDEPFANFERALKPSESLTRIHFNLTEAQAAAGIVFRVTFRLIGFNSDPQYTLGNLPWITATWNDTQVLTNADIPDPSIEQAAFVAEDVGAVPGENTLTIARSGEGNEWVQFDYIKMEYVNPYSPVWQLGYEDNNQAEFSQESFSENPPPGSPTVKDNDYYFAGQYPAPIGIVTTNEPWLNFERALTGSELDSRIHFNLTAAQAAPDKELLVTFKMFSFNNDPLCCDAGPTATIWAKWNDTEVLAPTDVTDPTTVRIGPLATGATGPVPGDNTLTISRSADGNAWIQFDYIKLEVKPKESTGALRITQSGWDAFGFTILWNSVPGRTYQVQTSTDLKTWTTLVASYPDGGATDVLTSYTDTAANLTEAKRFYRVVDNTPAPVFFDNFESGIGGWQVIDQNFSGTTWELGKPANGPGAAHSGNNVFGAGLTANYAPGTEILLLSKVINLTGVTNAVLEFWDYRDMEAPQPGAQPPDYGAVDIVDESGQPIADVPTLFSKGGATNGWRKESIALPEAALGGAIRLQFHFSSDSQNESAGWFIDDVAVRPK